MKRFLAISGMVLWMLSRLQMRADSEIVVAMRYLQPEGVSHAKLYLYREDGKLLRQLTHDGLGQVMNPVFAPNGETIVFERLKGKAKTYWSIEPKGDNLRKLAAAPAWYLATKSSPHFDEDDSSHALPVHKTPDGAQEIELIRDTEKEMEAMDYDTTKYGRHSLLTDLNTGEKVEFGSLEGFSGLYGMLCNTEKADEYFLFQGKLRVAFFWVHLNSTDGNTVYALDLTTKKFVRLSGNWAEPFPLPGEPAFLTYTEARYESIPGSTKSANSSYLDHWDAGLKRVRYAHEGAAIFYGGSMYRPSKSPAVVTMSYHLEPF